MSILGRLLRYVQSNGYPLASTPIAPKRRPKRTDSARPTSIEQMEPRLLMTTVFGGEIFQYKDARGDIVQAQVNGNNTVAELIGAIQSADDGSLIFGNIGGTVTPTNPNTALRGTTILGNGSVEASGDEVNGSRTNITDPVIPGNSVSVNANPGEIKITGLSSNSSGVLYGFNVFQPGDNIPDTSIKRTVIQLLQFNSSTGAATVYRTLDVTDNPASTFDVGTVTGTDMAPVPVTAATAIEAAAFDPNNPNILYFVARGSNVSGNGTFDTVESLWAYNFTTDSFTEEGGNFGGDLAGKNLVQAITINPTSNSTADLWVFQKNGNASQGQAAASLYSISYTDPNDPTGQIVPTVDTDNLNAVLTVHEGYVENPPVVTAITGLSFQSGDSSHIYAIENTGNSSHLLRISTDSGAATDWGSLTDQLYAKNHQNGNQAIAGNNLVSLTFNPNITNPFTGATGALMAVDTINDFVSGNASTHDLMFVDGSLRIDTGDVYAVYTNQADMTSSIAFQTGTLDSKGKFTSALYEGNFGDFAPEHIDGVTVVVPGNIGKGYLGFLGNLPNGDNGKFTAANPFLSGTLTSGIGIFPSMYSTSADLTVAPSTTLTPGLTVGYSLESFANASTTATIAGKILGSSFNSVQGLAIKNDGTIAVVNTDSFGAFTAGDQLGFVNPQTGAITGTPVTITNNGVPLSNIQGLAYGDANLDGNDLLYAIYDIGDGNGPTLGTIDETTGDFTPIGALGLGANARVKAMAFTAGGTGFDPLHKGLFVAYDPDQLDTDQTLTLAQVDPTTGLSTGDIDQLLDLSDSPVTMSSMLFDPAGDLIVHDTASGQLLSYTLDTTGATADLGDPIAVSATGSVNPTVGGIALDPLTNTYYAVDNETGISDGVRNAGLVSSVLMTLKDFSNNAQTQVVDPNEDVNLGKFLFDGTVTGKVFVSGSMDTFYSGWLITGDSTAAALGGAEWIGPTVDLTDNFQVNGDIRNVLSLGSIGTDGVVTADNHGVPAYDTGTQIIAGGKIGDVDSDGMVEALVRAGDSTSAPEVSDGTSITGFYAGVTGVVQGQTSFVNGTATVTPGAVLGTDPRLSDVLTLTDGTADDFGSQFSSVAQSVDQFSTSFTYQDGGAFGAGAGTDEGFAFVLENQGVTALQTANTTGLGYQGLAHSAAILFNINSATGGPETGLGINGNLSYTSTGSVNLASGDPISVFLNYDGSLLTETLVDQATQDTFTTSYAVDLATVLGSHTALVGFTGDSTTGATQTITSFQYNGGGTQQSEIQKWTISTKPPQYLFGNGNIVDANGITPFSDTTFNTAQYLGTVRSYTNGQPDVIDLNGELQAIDANGALGPDPVDYYGVSLLAGQTIQVQLSSIPDQVYLNDLGETVSFPANINLGIFDPDGRLIATDYSDVDPAQLQGKMIQITADRPGVYRIAVAIAGDYTFATTPPAGFVPGDFGYNLKVAGVGDLAIGGVVAGGGVVLSQSALPTLDPDTDLFFYTPSIEATSGDIGAIVAGVNPASVNGNSVIAPFGASGLFIPVIANPAGATLLAGATPTDDITVDQGNLRAVVGSSIGQERTGFLGYDFVPDFDVNGTVGLLQATGASAGDTAPALVAYFGNAATGAIQRIDSAGDVGGFYRTDKGIGTVDAATIEWGDSLVEFHVNVDNTGNDGIIDYIGVTGDLGTLAYGGPAIITGPGGDLRILDVGGAVYQDHFFAGGQSNLGAIVHGAGLTVTMSDDSGAVLTLVPGQVPNPLAGLPIVGKPGKVQPATVPGQLTTTAYGIRGAGGVALINVTSTGGLTVNVAAGGSGRSAEIGHIVVGGAGIPLTFLPSGAPALSNVTVAGQIANNVIINATGSARVDVFDITTNGGTIDNISNNTDGDLLDINANDVGNIFSHGNVGTMTSFAGAGAILPIETFSNAYPFVDQNSGITVDNAVSISSDKAVGNIIANGVIGTITANKDGVNDPNTFEGIDGPIVINGENTPTVIPTGGGLLVPISISQVNIGEGIASSGTGAMSRAGIYAAGRIVSVTGTNADIRGNIISTAGFGGIGNITLNNGSIIDANIEDLTTVDMSTEFAQNVTVPEGSQDIDHPLFEISNVTINGNGGIIGTRFEASSLGNFTVGSAGFGIFDSDFITLPDGVINSIVAGGYGIRGVVVEGAARVGTISATGSGAMSALTNYELSVRLSEHNAVDPFEGFAPNGLTDIDFYMNGNGTPLFPPSPSGLETGVIEAVNASGQDSLGNLSAFTIVDSVFNYANAVGNVTVRSDLTGFQLITGQLTSFKVAGNATDLDVEVAGKIGNVAIAGSFLDDGNTGVDIGEAGDVVPSQIVAKGPSGDIGNVTIGGDFDATLTAQGRIGSVTIGKPGVGNNPGTGNFDGTLTIHGNSLTLAAIDLLKIYGAITGGTIILNGNVGTIDVADDLGNLLQDLVVGGNLAALKVGSDVHVNGSSITSPLLIQGNLTSATITGNVSANVTVKGNIGNFTITADPTTLGTDLITNAGGVTAGGTIGSLTVTGGSVGGNIAAGSTITGVTITNGSLDSGAQISSALGNVTKLTITNGSLNGSVLANNGAIGGITITGAGQGVGVGASISARSTGPITMLGDFNGALATTGAAGTLTTRGITATAAINVGSFSTITAKGNIDGAITSGVSTASETITGSGDLNGTITLASPASVSIAGNMNTGASIATTSSLTSVSVKGNVSGDVFVDGLLGTFSAGTMSNSVVTAGMGITSVNVTGAVSNSLIQAGLSRGSDHIFGTADFGEQPRMADIGTLTVGLMTASIIAAGGNVGTYKSKGTMTDSSVSAGLVLSGAAIEAVITDPTPLANAAEQNAARDATLFHGNITSATVGATGITMINSAITAGVSPGADGNFSTAADNNVSSSITGGISKIGTVKAGLDGTSVVLANAASTGVTPVTVVHYTLDNSTNSIIPTDPINPAQLVATATSGHNATYTLGGNTITIKVTGPTTASVKLYDNGSLVDGVADTLVIDGAGSTSGLTVTVTTSAPGTFDLGRVLTTDGTVVSAFTFNGDIKGDPNGGPALYIDSDIGTLSFRNMPNDSTWSGMIGGNVANLTLNSQGPGLLRIGGKVTAYKASFSQGNPLIQQLGSISLVGGLTQLAFDPSTSNSFGIDANGNLVTVDPATGATVNLGPVTIPVSGTAVTLDGITFDSDSNLYGVTDINNLSPVVDVGSISDGDQLRGLAVNSHGVIYAIDSSSGDDTLVTLDPTTGLETTVGTLKDPSSDTFSNNVLAIAFDQNDNLIALLNDKDGNGSVDTTANGVAIARISTTPTGGVVLVSNPTTGGLPAHSVLLTGTVLGNFTGLAVDASGQIWAVRNNGTSDELDKITITGSAASAAAALSVVGNVQINGVDTAIVGMGFDENGTLVALNTDLSDPTTRDLIAISLTDPTNLSANLTVPGSFPDSTGSGIIDNELAGFALGKSGTFFQSYGYTTDPSFGGELFTNTGVAPTLGIISTTGPTAGQFLQLDPLAQDSNFTPLAGQVKALAIDDSGDVFVVTKSGQLAEYNADDGSIQGDAPLGFIRDNVTNNILDISQLAFDDAGNLIGLNAQQDRLVTINPNNTFTFDGLPAVSASALTNFGSVDAADLSGFTFSTDSGTFLSYSAATGGIISLLATSPATLGGIVANSFGTVTLPGQFGGRLSATGTSTGSSIATVKISGAGTFSGAVETAGSIGAVTSTGAIFAGAVVAGGDMTSASVVGGAFAPTGIISANGKLGTFTFDGQGESNFSGSLLAGSAATITVKGATFAGSLIEVAQNVATLTITGVVNGAIQLGSVGSMTVAGTLAAGSTVLLTNDAGTVKLGGVDLGGSFLAYQGLSSLTVGGTLAGVVATRRSVATVSVNNVTAGVLTVGGDIKTLTVLGNVTDSVLSSGVWIGADGIYNTSDDVIFGGSITSATVKGIWTDSMLTAGVLPPEGTAAAADNNLPANFNVFVGDPTAPTLVDQSSMEAGGIAPSTISALKFLQMVISTDAIDGLLSGVVAADGLGAVTDPAGSDLTELVVPNPIGIPTVVSATLVDNNTVKVVFSEPLDTSTINNDNFTVDDGFGDFFNDLTFAYSTQTAADGSTQGVVTITSAGGFDDLDSVNVTIGGKLTDQTGPRSALYDFNQDGNVNVSEDPFGGAATSGGVTTT